MKPSRGVSGLLLAASVLAAAAVPALAEVVVLQSTAPALRAGATLQDRDPIEVPAGKSALLVLPNGATRTLSGPFKGHAGDLTKGVAVDRELMGAVRTYIESGGASSRRVGATRSARPAAPARSAFPGWAEVPLLAGGDYCLDGSATPLLARSNTFGSLDVTVTNLRTSERARATFADGSRTAPWPAGVTLADGATYAIAAADLPMRTLQVRLVRPVPAAEDTLRVLHRHRCVTQMRQWLDALARAASR